MKEVDLQKLKKGYASAQVEDFNGIQIVSVNKKHLDWFFEQIEQQQQEIEGLEEENGAMAEKHAEKDVAINNLLQENKRLSEALNEISQIGYSDKFGGGWTYTGEHHARCMKIAMETLKKYF